MSESTNIKDVFKIVKKQAKNRRYSIVLENNVTNIDNVWKIFNVA